MTHGAVITLTPILGGFRLFETQTHYVDALAMLYNWRLVTVPKTHPESYDRAWCYQGTGSATLAAVIAAARVWGGDPDSEPVGWIKRAL